MTAIPKTTPSPYRFEFDHSEAVMRAIYALTIDPLINIFCYIVPWIGAYSAYQMQIRPNDKLQMSLFSESSKTAIAEKIDALRIKAGIGRKVDFYTSLNFSCSSYGGTYSITNPVVSIPAPFLITPGTSIFSESNPTVQEDDQKWIFTTDEVSFFVAREMANIQSNDNFLRLLTRVLFVGILFFIATIPTTVFLGAAMGGLSALLYVHSEKKFEAKLDLLAVKILTAYYNDSDRAHNAALSALEKLRQQNIGRRETNSFCRYYITEEGNNLIDLIHPFLTARIKQVSS